MSEKIDELNKAITASDNRAVEDKDKEIVALNSRITASVCVADNFGKDPITPKTYSRQFRLIADILRPNKGAE